MPRIDIQNLDDPRIAVYRHLKATNLTRHSDEFVVEGEKLLESLGASRFPMVSALATDRQADRIAAKVPSDIPLYVLPQSRISELVGYNFHQGVLAGGRRVDWPSLDAMLAEAGPRMTLVACPRIDNPENLGAMIRLADVFGVDAVLVGPRAPDPLSRRVLRVSMGTSLHRPLHRLENLEATIDRLRDHWGFSFVAAVTDTDATPLPQVVRPDRLALVFGAESAGLDPEWVARCDRSITIPMRRGAESLNLAVAAGIILYQLTEPAVCEDPGHSAWESRVTPIPPS